MSSSNRLLPNRDQLRVIIRGTGANVHDLFRNFAHLAARIAGRDRVFGYIPGHDATGANDGARPYLNAGENDPEFSKREYSWQNDEKQVHIGIDVGKALPHTLLHGNRDIAAWMRMCKMNE